MATRLTIVEGNSNDKDNVRAYMVKGEQGSTEWGDLQGDINNQTDLINMVDEKIENELEAFEHLDYQIVDTLPSTGETGVRYLVKHPTDDRYEEYIYINGQWYDIGGTGDIDVTGGNVAGSVTMFAGDVVPTGYLLCDGSAVSRTTYSKLYLAIGDRYGAGDGSTTFNLPNLKGKIPVGYDSTDTDFNTLGKTGGEKTHQLTKAEQPKVTGAFLGRLFGTSQTNLVGNWSGDNQVFKLSFDGDRWSKYINANDANATKNTTKISFDNQGNDEAHNNLQPYITMNYIIKY